jgi:hypothetical protein
MASSNLLGLLAIRGLGNAIKKGSFGTLSIGASEEARMVAIR